MVDKLAFREWQQLIFSLRICYHRRVRPKYQHFRQVHPDSWAFWMVEEGSVQICWGKKHQASAVAGEILQPPPLATRTQDFSEDARILSIGWQAHWPMGLPLYSQPEALILPVSKYPELGRASLKMVETFGSSYDGIETGKPVQRSISVWGQAEQVFFHWFEYWAMMMESEGCTFNHHASLDPRMHLGVQLLQASAVSGPVPYEQLCRTMQLSQVQVDRLFKQHLGMSPKDYLNRCILIRATDEVLANRLTCREISDLLGFSSQAHFSTWFQRQTQHSPQSYRKVHNY